MIDVYSDDNIGAKGEYLAKCYLQEKGYDFVRANFKTKHGEIDLILIDDNEIVFVEVKTRTFHSAEKFGRGIEKIDKDKMRHIRFAADIFIRQEKYLTRNLSPRFDAVEIYIDSSDKERIVVNHIKAAF